MVLAAKPDIRRQHLRRRGRSWTLTPRCRPTRAWPPATVSRPRSRKRWAFSRRPWVVYRVQAPGPSCRSDRLEVALPHLVHRTSDRRGDLRPGSRLVCRRDNPRRPRSRRPCGSVSENPRACVRVRLRERRPDVPRDRLPFSAPGPRTASHDLTGKKSIYELLARAT